MVQQIADPKISDELPFGSEPRPRPRGRRYAHTSSRIGSAVVSSREFAILIGRPIGVSYSLVQSIPNALYTVAKTSPMLVWRLAGLAPFSSLAPTTRPVLIPPPPSTSDQQVGQ